MERGLYLNIMTDEELLNKWERVLDYDGEYVGKITDPEKRLECAKAMEGEGEWAIGIKKETGKSCSLYLSHMIPYIRAEYSGTPLYEFRTIKDTIYIISDVTVVHRISKEKRGGDFLPFKTEDKIIKWAFPILDEPTNENYKNNHRLQDHVFCGGYTDGKYNRCPEYGQSLESLLDGELIK